MFFFFFNDTATTEIYTLSLHDALPISSGTTFSGPPILPRSSSSTRNRSSAARSRSSNPPRATSSSPPSAPSTTSSRSEEHTSELQSRQYLVCRLLLEKKTNNVTYEKTS